MFHAPLWVNKCRTGSEAERSDRVRINCHKQAKPRCTSVERFQRGSGRSAPLRSRFCFAVAAIPRFCICWLRICGFKSLFVQSIVRRCSKWLFVQIN